MRQYFEVGEEVILCSKYSPELNGEYIVEAVEYRTGRVITTGDIITTFWYKLNTNVDHTNWWTQSSLRKKHQPGDDFQDIMNKLKEKEEVY